jgi:hypothetical protein
VANAAQQCNVSVHPIAPFDSTNLLLAMKALTRHVRQHDCFQTGYATDILDKQFAVRPGFDRSCKVLTALI